MHILVADDDLPSVKLTSFLLEEAGYRVFKAYDGPSIMQALEQYNPDLILLDVEVQRLRHLPADSPDVRCTDHLLVSPFAAARPCDWPADRRRRLSRQAV